MKLLLNIGPDIVTWITDRLEKALCMVCNRLKSRTNAAQSGFSAKKRRGAGRS